jgi:hypothetical protein
MWSYAQATMGLTEREREWGQKASRFLKAELKRAGVGYKELADRLNRHGLEETETSITGKLSRGTFAVSFFLAVLAVLELEGVELSELVSESRNYALSIKSSTIDRA